MGLYAVDFKEIDKTMLTAVGGKGANLGELSKIDAIRVPGGFCISTKAYQRIINENSAIEKMLDRLLALKADNLEKIRELSSEIRQIIEEIAIPGDIIEEITIALKIYGEENAYAVRSSATAEDLPNASFAGQQDSFLNIIGLEALLTHISKCWASLYTERAIIYRIHNGFDHKKVSLSVVVQRMVFPDVSGIMF
ncbi:MAG: PEP/pyruvate-binding domain-containing protein, partial [Chloroflexota bacterium]